MILVGEMRDLETINLAISAAEAGHLVFATLHTISAAKTIDRIIGVFPGDQQGHIRTMLSESLKAVVSQTLLKRRDEAGRVAACEVLLHTWAVASIIREGSNALTKLNDIMLGGRRMGMQTLDDAIEQLFRSGTIGGQEAYMKAFQKERFALVREEARTP